MRRRKKIGLWVAGVLLTPVLIVLLLVGLFYLPPVQQWAIGRVCAYASEQTGMDIRLERIRITPLLDLDLQQLTATTPPDTILAVRHAVVDLDLRHILRGRLSVEALDLRDGVVDTRDLIATVGIRGRLGNLHLNADDIHLKEQRAALTGARLDDCDVDIALRDTTVIDTSESAPVRWSIGLGHIEARRTRVAFHTVGDSLSVSGSVRELVLQDGNADLGQGVYRAGHVRLDADSLHYDLNYEPRTEGLDYNHIAAYDVRADVDDLYYRLEGNELSLVVRQAQAREQSGLEVSRLAGRVALDNASLHLPDLSLATPHSTVEGRLDMDWSALSPGGGGTLDADLNARIGRADLLAVAGGYLSADQRRFIPKEPITLSGKVSGNVDCLAMEDGLLMVPASARLPQVKVTGKAGMQGSRLTADLLLSQGAGRATLRGNYNTKTEAYEADLSVRNLNLHNFLPQDSLYLLTARAKVSGRGTDLLAPSTRIRAEADIEHLQYGRNSIDNVQLTAHAQRGEGTVNLYSNNDILVADACANLKFDRKITDLDFTLGLSRIDLHALGITQKPLRLAMLMQAEGSTNLRDTHRVSGNIKAVELDVTEGTFYPSDIDLSLLMAPDTLFAEATSGDLFLELHSREGLEQLTERANLLSTELKRQLTEHRIAQDTLKALLPRLDLRLRSGRENTVAKIIESMGYSYDRLSLTLDSDPASGLNGNGYLHALNTGAVLLDTIQWHVYQDSTDVVNLAARVKNGPKNRQVVFESALTAELTPTGAEAAIQFFDAKGRKGVDLGAQLSIEDDGYRLHLYPLNPILAYRTFTLNKDNYVYLHDDKRVEANVDLLADDGTGFQLYSTPNEEALQDVTLSVHNFNIGELANVIPYMPHLGGLLAGDFHLVQDEQSMSVLIDANVQRLMYEGAEMGDVGLNAVYLPNPDGTHYVDGIVSQNGREVMLLAGTYNPEGEGSIDAKATLERLPLTLANGFIPERTAALSGYAVGELDVTGSVSAPVLNGDLMTDSMHLSSDMYSLQLRFPDDTIHIRQSYIDLERIEAYSIGKNPLVLDGTIDFRDLDNIGLNLRLSARNFELINAPKTQKAVAYGKVYVNVGARLTGTLNDILLRGKLDVLGNTDVTYVLTDSPLTVEDQLAELVTFVDFSDTLAVAEVQKASPQNIDMTMDITIEQAAQVHCLLSADGTNYVDLEGGGDLTMTYTSQDGTQLYGRYTIVSGLMNYSLMVVALKNFSIQNGSYVEFTGDMMNPKLSISASERVKTTVYENNVPRSVNFDVGLAVSQTLDNMGLEFTLEAPGDMTISNQLATMSLEERGKVAVTMLATGMYLTESGNGTSGFSATNALNSFLQTQISNISNKALSTIDLNFGIDNTNTASGGTQTDYSFSFAKRFWGNRISLIVGGKVSSGSEAQNTGQSIINNVSIEYRLDKSATRYVRVYYDRDTESLLEGDITEMGAGVVFRKKSTRLGELFLFRKK